MDILAKGFIRPTKRVEKLKEEIFSATPYIEADRAIILTESFKETENEPIIIRKAKSLEKILNEIPIVIRDNELIVGSLTKNPRSCQVFPEFSNQWLVDEFDKFEKRTSDLFKIPEETKSKLKEVFKYWQGKTVSELATSYMTNETKDAMNTKVFTVANYHFNGLGHISVDYPKVLEKGFLGIIKETENAIINADKSNPEYVKKKVFWDSIIISCKAAIKYANRYSELAKKLAGETLDINRKNELLKIAEICSKVPANPAETFYEACQSFWFVQAIISLESNGHAISPARFDQYMYPYYKNDIDNKFATKEVNTEILHCLWVKFNDLTKVRDETTTKAFSGYSMFQNLIVGGQTPDGKDATNELSYMCLEATGSLKLPQPSLCVRIWSKTPDEFLIRTCELTRLGTGLPAFYNDEVVIPTLINQGLTIEDARDYAIVGCVEPQKPGKTDGWYDAAFFNLAKILELSMNNGRLNGKQVGPETGEFTSFKNIDDFINAYKKQIEYFVFHMVAADNCVDIAHAERAPLPFLSSMLDDCIGTGKSIQEGGGHYRFSGPLGVGIANVGDSFMAIKKLIFDENKITLLKLKAAVDSNFGENEDDPIKKAEYEDIKQLILNRVPKFGNDIDEVDEFTRDGALIYCKEVLKYTNQRGGKFIPGLYPVSNNVYLGSLVGATPDGRNAFKPLADGVSPTRGADVNGPTAAANSVSKLEHFAAPSGTLFNQKFNPNSLQGDNGLKNLGSLIRSYFDRKGMHIQFNVIDKKVLLEAQKHPEQYRDLIVRVAGYSAQFICLDKGVQDDIIKRTEQNL
ncbi:glycyl radical protein [Clostridium botulinum]|uniref:glycyl radical protein n=1 Tax=Clostridium botulinum TaxID=1491 RepID=UPI000772F1CE|nr:glycyl radical protein [Clostridium botulinum]MBN1042012.1 formate C-acetyltransferase/glycerol dehydratase family glycyl radical enzyme [Clostridium botulinum]MBN1061760.1 formate C-acetyltransferase/glycerol dehydratase family glycyl radical enzyme [Clostridium botulinum]MBY6838020.1 glycyl radical protein [Clostridium botulinum]MBY6915985.1 glycyl radical protein [Clostridium botulinum]NFE74062.1 glycyl radical protein [Clostridium botulinum]